MPNFNPNTVELEGSNLVEASAGTGKTYSIGLLVLRLLLEKDVKIEKILMVTFTNAAVAELAARIRKFLKEAVKAVKFGECDEKPVERLIAGQPNKKVALERLEAAIKQLDEAAIQTIHSFCQESLNTFALDAAQPFGLELKTNIQEIANNQVKEFWRREITPLPKELLLEIKAISFANLESAVKESIGGKIYHTENTEQPALEKFATDFNIFQEAYEKNKDAIVKSIRLFDRTKIDNFQQRYQDSLVDKVVEFNEYFALLTSTTGYKAELAGRLFPKEKIKAQELLFQKENCCHWFFSECIREVQEKVKQYLEDNHLLTYDEIIKRMHTAVMKSDNKPFRAALRDKFDAVFIDEFQDTDRLQYEIYHRLFGKGKTIFFIGDPKQSIYAWRKADLNTYFRAKKDIDRHFEMNVNFRSSKAYVEAVSQFYDRGQDPFKTKKSDLDINYLPVTANDTTSSGLTHPERKMKPLQMFDGGTKGKIKSLAKRLVHDILFGGYKLNGKDVVKSDIGILVRSNKEAQEVKSLLANEGIHAITIDDSSIYKDSEEAKSLRYIMEAVLNITEKNISKALLNSFTGYSYKKVSAIKKEELLDTFRGYRDIWKESGIYPMIRKYMEDLDVMRHLMEEEGPERIKDPEQSHPAPGTAAGSGVPAGIKADGTLRLPGETNCRQFRRGR